MKRNPLGQRNFGGGKAYSLLKAQRAYSTNIYVREARPERPANISCKGIREEIHLLVTEDQVYCATINSFTPLNRRATRVETLRDLLSSGATLATTRAFFRLSPEGAHA